MNNKKKTIVEKVVDAIVHPDAEVAPISKTESSPAPALVCIRECEMPDVGAFKHGQLVTRPDLVEKLTDHPYFKPSEDK